MQSRPFLLLFFVNISILTELSAQDDSIIHPLETQIIDNFSSLLAEKVTNDLLANYKIYLKYPNEYWNFLTETLLVNWDFDVTTKALLGNEISSSLSDLQFKELSTTLKVTLMRYAFESLFFYGKQKLDVIDIKINGQQNFAWLKINMESPRFTDIHLDLLIIRTDDGKWKGADFRFKGVTYVNLKKNSYRQDFKELGFRGLLTHLKGTNKVFFEDLCKSEANYVDPQKPPCKSSYD